MKRLLAILLVAGWAVAHAADKPNLILILADDRDEFINMGGK